MSVLNLSGEELLAWSDLTAKKWRDFVTANPAVLAVPCDIREEGTAGKLMQHIVAVELRYAQRLAMVPETEYASVPYSNADEILAVHEQAVTLLREVMAKPDFDWQQEIEFTTMSIGRMRSRRKTVFVHVMMHSVRHYAQLATLVRQHGFKPDWPMDYLFMNMAKA